MTTEFPPFAKPRDTLDAILAHVLAEESQLAATTHDYVWRVRGSPRQSVKRLFAEQARQIDHWVRAISERAAAVAGGAGTGGEERPPRAAGDAAVAPTAALAAILSRHEAMAAQLRVTVEPLRDRDPQADAAVLLSGLLDFHETSAWMLRLVLESPDHPPSLC